MDNLQTHLKYRAELRLHTVAAVGCFLIAFVWIVAMTSDWVSGKSTPWQEALFPLVFFAGAAVNIFNRRRMAAQPRLAAKAWTSDMLALVAPFVAVPIIAVAGVLVARQQFDSERGVILGISFAVAVLLIVVWHRVRSRHAE